MNLYRRKKNKPRVNEIVLVGNRAQDAFGLGKYQFYGIIIDCKPELLARLSRVLVQHYLL